MCSSDLIVAEAISVKYKNLSELFNEYSKYESNSDKEQMLSEIMINEKRKIGKALSKKIYESFYKSN